MSKGVAFVQILVRIIVFGALLGVFMSAKKSGEMMKGDDSPTGEMKN